MAIFRNFNRLAQRVVKGTQNFVHAIPRHINTGRKFADAFVKGSQNANRLVQNTTSAATESGLLGAKGQGFARDISQFSATGVQKLSDLHNRVGKFTDRLQSLQATTAT